MILLQNGAGQCCSGFAASAEGLHEDLMLLDVTERGESLKTCAATAAAKVTVVSDHCTALHCTALQFPPTLIAGFLHSGKACQPSEERIIAYKA